MNLDSAILYTNDVEVIENFYKDTLGLELEYRQGDSYLSFIFPNGVRLGIKKAKEEREVPGGQTIFLSVDNIEELYELCKKESFSILKDITRDTWGINFSILDPDKNKVQFVKRY